MNTKRTNKTAREACTTGRVLRPTSSERLRRRSDGNDGPVERVRSSRLSVSPCPLALSSGGGGGGVREIFQKTVVVVVIAAATAAVASAYGVRCYERGAPPLIFPPPPPPPFTTYRSFLIPGPLRPMIETTKPVMNVYRRYSTTTPVGVNKTINRRVKAIRENYRFPIVLNFIGSVMTSSRKIWFPRHGDNPQRLYVKSRF